MPYPHSFPPPQGLYDPRHEHDACGVAFVATLTGEASHEIVATSLTALRNLEHRGAAGAEPNSGDGAGILMQVPDAFLRAVAARPASSSRRRVPTPSVRRSCPETTRPSPRPAPRSRRSPPRKGSRSSAGERSRSGRTASARRRSV